MITECLLLTENLCHLSRCDRQTRYLIIRGVLTFEGSDGVIFHTETDACSPFLSVPQLNTQPHYQGQEYGKCIDIKGQWKDVVIFHTQTDACTPFLSL